MTYHAVRSLRIEHQISQMKLAEYSGYSPASISNWERNKSQPTPEQLNQLLTAISQIVTAKHELGIDIRKKRIQHGEKVKRNTPGQIRTKTQYHQRMDQVHFPPNPYAIQMNRMHACYPQPSDHTPKAVSLFSGCGGLTLGFQWAGFHVAGHVEIDDSIHEIYQANFPNSTLLGKDITKLTDREIKQWTTRLGTIDILTGGPPCQGFSLAGKRNPEDERNELFQHYIRIVDLLQPKAFVMENVRLMMSMRDKDGRLFLDRVVKGFQQIGYQIALKVVNAQEYGVPQFRERLFLVGAHKGKTQTVFTFPEPTHVNGGLSFRDAVSDLPLLESGETSSDPLHWAITHPAHVIAWLKDVPQGHSAHENENPALRPSSGFNTTYKRLIWDEPCSTISTNFNMISGCRNVHPSATRSLTIREAARAQSFPDRFVFLGKWSAIRRAIGNAVPPLLAKAMADSIMEQLFQS